MIPKYHPRTPQNHAKKPRRTFVHAGVLLWYCKGLKRRLNRSERMGWMLRWKWEKAPKGLWSEVLKTDDISFYVVVNPIAHSKSYFCYWYGAFSILPSHYSVRENLSFRLALHTITLASSKKSKAMQASKINHAKAPRMMTETIISMVTPYDVLTQYHAPR